MKKLDHIEYNIHMTNGTVEHTDTLEGVKNNSSVVKVLTVFFYTDGSVLLA